MAETLTLKAEARTKSSKGAVRSLRLAGRVPAVIYGDKQTPQLISIDYKTVSALYMKGAFTSNAINIDVDGKVERVIPRDVQREVVRDFVIHVDFLRLGKNSTIHVDVPVNFINQETSIGLKAGGTLNIVRHEVELICPADSIPASIEVDLAPFNLGDSIHISAVKLPANVRPAISDRDFTIATIATPAATASAGGDDAKEAAAAASAKEAAAAKAAPAGVKAPEKK